MNNLKLLARKAGVIAVAIFSALLDTLVAAVGIIVVGALASMILPVAIWFSTAVLAKAKLKMLR